jgi:hypothetical protein
VFANPARSSSLIVARRGGITAATRRRGYTVHRTCVIGCALWAVPSSQNATPADAMQRLAVKHRCGRVLSPVSAPRWWPSASCRRNATSSPRRPGRAVSRCRSSSGPARCNRPAHPQPKSRPGYRSAPCSPHKACRRIGCSIEPLRASEGRSPLLRSRSVVTRTVNACVTGCHFVVLLVRG